VIDEAETILRMRSDSRGKSLNGIRQIIDAADRYRGLLWIFTGTPDFFDKPRGVAGLEPLYARIQFLEQGGMASLRQPQLQLRPFDKDRLREVALKLRELYPAPDRAALEATVTPAFIEKLIAKVSEGFRGDVGVVPRQFLRRLVDILDLATENPGFDPGKEMGFELVDPTVDEERLAAGQPPYDPEPEDDKGYKPAALEF